LLLIGLGAAKNSNKRLKIQRGDFTCLTGSPQ
jgi:hypothetical protein